MILWGEFAKTTSRFHCLFCVVVRDFTQWATSEIISLIGLVFSFPLFNYLMSIKPHLIYNSQYEGLSINSARPEKAAYKLSKPRSHSDVTFVQRRLARL